MLGYYFWVQCFGSDSAASVSKPADTSNTLVQVNYMESGLTSLGAKFFIDLATSTGTYSWSTDILRTGEA